MLRISSLDIERGTLISARFCFARFIVK